MNAQEVVDQLETDIKKQNMPKEQADALRAVCKTAFKCTAYCLDTIDRSKLRPDLMIDAEVSVIQSLLGTNIMRAMKLNDGQPIDLSYHLQRFLNVTLNQLGYNATISSRSKN